MDELLQRNLSILVHVKYVEDSLGEKSALANGNNPFEFLEVHILLGIAHILPEHPPQAIFNFGAELKLWVQCDRHDKAHEISNFKLAEGVFAEGDHDLFGDNWRGENVVERFGRHSFLVANHIGHRLNQIYKVDPILLLRSYIVVQRNLKILH